MRDNGAARGVGRGIATGRGPDPDFILGRGEMAAAGCPPAELPFFRDWCRSRLNPLYFRMDEPVSRAAMLIEHVETYAQELVKASPDRAERMGPAMRAAAEAHRLHVSTLRRYRLRSMPTMPDPRMTGATPTGVEDEAPRGKRGAREDAEEAWDPSWGDPDADLPPARPQGMRALPERDTPIDVEPPRPHGRSPEPRPPSTNPKAVGEKRRRAGAREAREKLTGPLAPPKPKG